MNKLGYKAKVVIVGGCGHVGFPLGLVLADSGYKVTLLDISQEKVDSINRKNIPFQEIGAAALLEKYAGNLLTASTDPEVLRDCSVVIFSLGTPVDEHHNPRLTDLVNGIWAYIDYLDAGKLIVLRSTLFPGTSEYLVNKFAARFGTVKLAFCPERIVQGKGIAEIHELPQIISGSNAETVEEARKLFGDIGGGVIELSLKEAEIGKLFTNSWRYLEFAIANQFYLLAEENGLDFYRIFKAITADYPRAASFAKAGLAAGPCLFKDTMQLAAFSNNNFFLGQAAMLVNEGLPNYLVMAIKRKLDNNLSGKSVAILGMTFKANNDDTRESLSFKIKKLLEFQEANVIMSDPYIPGSTPLEEALALADGIILGSPHREYLNLRPACPFVDCWGVWH